MVHPMTSLNRQLVLQTLRGYTEVERIVDVERRKRLQSQSIAESLAEFKVLYETWVKLGRDAGGVFTEIAQNRLQANLERRAIFEQLANHKGHLAK